MTNRNEERFFEPEGQQRQLLLIALSFVRPPGSAQAAAVATAASISKKRTSILNRINLGGFQTSTKIEALVRLRSKDAASSFLRTRCDCRRVWFFESKEVELTVY